MQCLQSLFINIKSSKRIILNKIVSQNVTEITNSLYQFVYSYLSPQTDRKDVITSKHLMKNLLKVPTRICILKNGCYFFKMSLHDRSKVMDSRSDRRTGQTWHTMFIHRGNMLFGSVQTHTKYIDHHGE